MFNYCLHEQIFIATQNHLQFSERILYLNKSNWNTYTTVTTTVQVSRNVVKCLSFTTKTAVTEPVSFNPSSVRLEISWFYYFCVLVSSGLTSLEKKFEFDIVQVLLGQHITFKNNNHVCLDLTSYFISYLMYISLYYSAWKFWRWANITCWYYQSYRQ